MKRTILQMMAMITMLVDHIGLVFCENAQVMRGIGRISFPLYTYMMQDAYRHIRSDQKRVRTYLFRLCLTALLAEIPYDAVFYGGFPNWERQNVIFTLLLAVTALFFTDVLRLPFYFNIPLGFLCGHVNDLIHGSYGLAGVMLVILMYDLEEFLHEKKKYRAAAFALLIFVFMVFSYTNMEPWRYGASCFGLPFKNPWRFAIFLDALLIHFYHGEKGKPSAFFLDVYKAFYPLHLWLFWLILLLCVQ